MKETEKMTKAVLTVKLKQHTPLLHFQHGQKGATLRASEVKPKLDRYILKNAIGSSFEDCKTFLVGYNEKKEIALKQKFEAEKFCALNYKLSISPLGDKNNNITLNPEPGQNQGGAWIADPFPLILSNMGGADSIDELVDFVYHDYVELKFYFQNEELKEYIEGWIDLFFATNNFGQRSDKGFGSFSVVEINGNRKIFPSNDEPFDGVRYLKFRLNGNEIGKQRKLFSVIDFYWKVLKSGINYTHIGQNVFPNRYIKSFLWTYLYSKGYTWEKRWVKENFNLTNGEERQENNNERFFARAILGCPDKFEYRSIPNDTVTINISHNKRERDENKIARIPSPIIFKPVLNNDRTGAEVRVYILFDESAIKELREIDDLTFKFTRNGNDCYLGIKTDVIDLEELIRLYHTYLRNNVSLLAFDDEDDRNTFEEEHELNDISWFIPLGFNWNRILGENGIVEMYRKRNV